MQATYAVTDDLGMAMQHGEPSGSDWRDLSSPTDINFGGWPSAEVSRVKGIDADFPLTQVQWASLRRDASTRAPNSNLYAGSNWLQANIRRKFLVSRLKDVLTDPERTEELA